MSNISKLEVYLVKIKFMPPQQPKPRLDHDILGDVVDDMLTVRHSGLPQLDTYNSPLDTDKDDEIRAIREFENGLLS